LERTTKAKEEAKAAVSWQAEEEEAGPRAEAVEASPAEAEATRPEKAMAGFASG
jgi:hypothetical protein